MFSNYRMKPEKILQKRERMIRFNRKRETIPEKLLQTFSAHTIITTTVNREIFVVKISSAGVLILLFPVEHSLPLNAPGHKHT